MPLWFPIATLSAALASPNLVLISLDTTRADALSCYGTPPGLPTPTTPITPHIDALARDGARFERFFANAPTTLSSHATMFTGLDPHGHAIVRNGFPLEDIHPTLSMRLFDAGYDTVAIVGSSALESAMGLDRGFRVYDDAVGDLVGMVYQDPAARVVERTLERVDGRDNDKPLFLFVHFYDAHAPYAAPEPYLDRFTDPAYDGTWKDGSTKYKPLIEQITAGTADPADVAFVAGRYAGEVSYVDAQVGRLIDALSARGLLDEALVVVTADHGENLTDFPFFAYSHGSDVGQGVMHVPLVMRGYDIPFAERAVIARQASMSGLAVTLERALGLTASLPGHPFWNLVRPGPVWDIDGWPERPTRPAFVEATRPRSLEPETGWNNGLFFRGVWSGGWGIYGAPIYKEPYTFYGDAAPGDAAVLPTLEAQLADWDSRAPPRREADLAPATTRALKALGYLAD